jgi:hypothetical protein
MRSTADMLLGAEGAQKLNERGPNRQPTMEEIRNTAGQALRSNPSDAVIASDLMKVYAGIGYMRYLDGEKHLVLLGSRIWFRKKEEDQVLAARANDARVVLDMIHTAGVEPPPRAGRPIVPSLASNPVLQIASSMNIAEYTGGYYTGVNYADKALARLDESTRFSYLLGYAPTNPALDGTLGRRTARGRRGIRSAGSVAGGTCR